MGPSTLETVRVGCELLVNPSPICLEPSTLGQSELYSLKLELGEELHLRL